jgi:hypothetical protein
MKKSIIWSTYVVLIFMVVLTACSQASSSSNTLLEPTLSSTSPSVSAPTTSPVTSVSSPATTTSLTTSISSPATTTSLTTSTTPPETAGSSTTSTSSPATTASPATSTSSTVTTASTTPSASAGPGVVPPAPNTLVSINLNPSTGIGAYQTNLTITEANTGNVVLTDVWVWVSNSDASFTSNCTRTGITYTGGDTNNNSRLDVGETWQWSIPNVTISGSTAFTATGHGIFTRVARSGITIQDITFNSLTGAYPSEQVTISVEYRQ